MDFHQTSAERFAEKIYNYICEKFDGKIMNSSECNVELMIKYIPFDINEDDIIDTDIEISNNDNNNSEDTPVDEETGDVTVTDNNEDELFTDNIIDEPSSHKKGKKGKKGKKKKKDKPTEENSVKKPRKPNKCIYFRTHPDNQQMIEVKNQEINPETGEIYNNKVKSGCALWKSLSTAEQEEWGVRCMADNSN